MMQIPRSLLPHSATQGYGAQTDDGWGGMSHASSRALTYVRFEPSSKLITTKDNKEIKLSAIMFFDCRNSGPAGTTFAIGDQIEKPGGTKYTVVGGVDPIYDATRPHHCEVELE
jgi:hypothetical protein